MNDYQFVILRKWVKIAIFSFILALINIAITIGCWHIILKLNGWESYQTITYMINIFIITLTTVFVVKEIPYSLQRTTLSKDVWFLRRERDELNEIIKIMEGTEKLHKDTKGQLTINDIKELSERKKS